MATKPPEKYPARKQPPEKYRGRRAPNRGTADPAVPGARGGYSVVSKPPSLPGRGSQIGTPGPPPTAAQRQANAARQANNARNNEALQRAYDQKFKKQAAPPSKTRARANAIQQRLGGK